MPRPLPRSTRMPPRCARPLGIEPELVVREGKPTEEIHKLIEEDQDIAILVLAAGAAKEGPGPLVASIAGKAAAFPIPVTVVPQNLSRRGDRQPRLSKPNFRGRRFAGSVSLEVPLQ